MAIVFAGLCFLPMRGLCGEGTNLIREGGFEPSLCLEGYPWRKDAWQFNPQAVGFFLDPASPKEGRYSARLKNIVDNDSRLVQTIPVRESRLYRVSGWIKTRSVSGLEGLSRENIGACLCLNGTWIRSPDLKGTHGWTKVEFFVRTGENQKNLPVSCRLGYAHNAVTGTAWFDGIEVRNVDVPKGDAPLFEEKKKASDALAGALFLFSAFLIVTLRSLWEKLKRKS